ncbi:MAG: hypothetical protein M1840_003316 [Geoglossum simile]|nr:MAG: hypothetical protein M1840_003316 [Geoglossum simile]
MAPSGMFSYLRPHHRRSSSGPKQVPPPSTSSLYSADSAVSSPDFQTHSQLAPPLPTRSSSPHSSTPPVSPLPPVLPQIPRVTSADDNQQDLNFLEGRNAWSSQGEDMGEARTASNTLLPASHGSTSTGTSPNTLLSAEFNANGNRPQSARSTGSKESLLGNTFSRTGAPPLLTHSPVSYSATSPVSTYYSSSSNHPSASTYPHPASSSRSVGLNSTPSLIPPRSGRTKLNLLNPMSLLMRRRANQPMAHLADSPHNKNPPILGMSDDYDPRIRGKIIHDFSAPRLRITSEQGNLSPNQTVGRGFGLTQTDESGRRPSATQGCRLLRVDVGLGGGRESPIDPRNGEHTPIFKEHFGDGISDDEGDGQAAKGRRDSREVGDQLGAPGVKLQNTVASTSQVAVPPPPDRLPPPLPQEARDILSGPSGTPPEVEKVLVETTESTRYTKPLGASGEGQEIEGLEKLENGPMGFGLVDGPAYGSSLPKHFKSNASRFSFEVSGIGSSSQEKLLEEAHRKTMAKRRSELPKRIHSFVDEFDERFDDEEMGDFDYYEDDGIFEEKIPGVNSDAIEDDGAFEEEIPGVNSVAVEDGGVYEEKISGVNCKNLEGDYQIVGGISGFDFGSQLHSPVASPATPYSVNSTGIMGTPRDANGQVIGFALSKESPVLRKDFAADAAEPPTQNAESGHHDGLGLVGVDISREPDDDELYFDDGIIEAPLEGGEHAFDESVFDDENNSVFGRPLRDSKKPLIPDPLRISVAANSSPAKHTREGDEDDSIVPQDSQATDTTFPPMMNPSGNGLGYRASLSRQQPLSADEHSSPPAVKQVPGIDLTQDNLAAYHNALVAAATAAAINGKLSRRDTVSLGDLGDYECEDPDLDSSPHPGLVPDSGRESEEVETGYGVFSSRGVYNGVDDFDYDDGLEDDLIIAEANAEALASDDEGFYGSEFGFYAHATVSDQAEYVAGGYFGPRGGITRTTSGRMREPNLTPITERSECSNRTSFAISLHGPPVQPGFASPGLAQLVDMMGGGFEDDEMNLNALRKLRRGAWGGSNGSLRSSGSAASQPGASPLSFHPPLGSSGSGLLPGPNLSVGAGSGFSLSNSPRFPSPNGYASDQDSAPASPTITLGNHTLGRWGGPGQRISGYSEGSSAPASPMATVFNTDPLKKSKHRREGSGGDSIAYLREEGEDGERWVLERRRTDEFGEVEIVGREVVEGGRI